MEDILDIICVYSKLNKLLDKSSIRKIISKALYLNDIDYSQYKIIFDPSYYETIVNKYSTRAAAEFFPHSRKIIINLNLLKSIIKDKRFKTDLKLEDELNDYESMLRKNMFILSIVLHEIEHIIQFKKTNNLDNNLLEKFLVLLEIVYLYDKNKILNDKSKNYFKRRNEYKNECINYTKNYDISLIERLANIKSQEKIIELINLECRDSNLSELENLLLLKNQMREYKHDYDIPTVTFFSNIKRKNEISFLNYKKYSYEDRIKYGFNLTEEEYQKNKILLLSQTKMKKN